MTTKSCSQFLNLLALLVISFPTMTSSDTPITNAKTIYLIRHAESEENRRLAALGKCFGDISRFQLPSSKDVASSLSLINVPAQIDSDVSEHGSWQIKAVGDELKRDNFLMHHGIELVAHSPLKRARQTSLGMLGCMTPSDKDVNVLKVEELDLLSEKTPAEWLPGNIGSLHSRIEQLEDWLRAQTANKIVLVGHSQYFKAMLGLKFKFGNCEVWQVELDAPSKDAIKEKYGSLPRAWSGLIRLYTVVLPNTDVDTNNTE